MIDGMILEQQHRATHQWNPLAQRVVETLDMAGFAG